METRSEARRELPALSCPSRRLLLLLLLGVPATEGGRLAERDLKSPNDPLRSSSNRLILERAENVPGPKLTSPSDGEAERSLSEVLDEDGVMKRMRVTLLNDFGVFCTRGPGTGDLEKRALSFVEASGAKGALFCGLD